MSAKILFVGIGSPHGDDQLGWHVADALADRLQTSDTAFPEEVTTGLNSPMLSKGHIAVRKAGNPVDVLDWIEGIERLIICDACRSGGPPGLAYRWNWPDRAIELVRSNGSHDLGLAGVLRLADRLQRIPPVVIVWGVEADGLKPQDDLSASVTARLPAVVDTIWSDIGHA